jgi:hypothetical protein
VTVYAGSHRLDERRHFVVDRFGEAIDMAARSNKIIREPAVGVASDERAVGTQVRLPDTAIQTHAAVKGGVNDDAIAAMQRGVSPVGHLADHFMAHDQRVADGDGAFEDVQIGPANAAVCNPDEDLTRPGGGPFDFGKPQVAGPSQDHCLH